MEVLVIEHCLAYKRGFPTIIQWFKEILPMLTESELIKFYNMKLGIKFEWNKVKKC